MEELVQTFGDDDEDYTPQSECRRTRSSSKLNDQKSEASYAAVAETKDLDISIYSSGSLTKDKRKRINRDKLEKEAKRKKVTSPIHPTSSISATKVTVAPQMVMTSPHPPPLTGNSLRICLLALLIL